MVVVKPTRTGRATAPDKVKGGLVPAFFFVNVMLLQAQIFAFQSSDKVCSNNFEAFTE